MVGFSAPLVAPTLSGQVFSGILCTLRHFSQVISDSSPVGISVMTDFQGAEKVEQPCPLALILNNIEDRQAPGRRKSFRPFRRTPQLPLGNPVPAKGETGVPWKSFQYAEVANGLPSEVMGTPSLEGFKPPAVSEMAWGLLLELEDLQGFSNSVILILWESKGCRRAENVSEIGSWTHNHSRPRILICGPNFRIFDFNGF